MSEAPDRRRDDAPDGLSQRSEQRHPGPSSDAQRLHVEPVRLDAVGDETYPRRTSDLATADDADPEHGKFNPEVIGAVRGSKHDAVTHGKIAKILLGNLEPVGLEELHSHSGRMMYDRSRSFSRNSCLILVPESLCGTPVLDRLERSVPIEFVR